MMIDLLKLKKYMKRNVTVFFILLLSCQQLFGQKSDTIKITFPNKEMPEWLINSSYTVKPLMVTNKQNEIFAILTEQLEGVSGNVSLKAVKVSSAGNIELEKFDLVPLDATIKSLLTDRNGEIWITTIERNEKKSQYSYAAIYHFNRNLERVSTLDLLTCYDPVTINWDAKGNMLLFTHADSLLRLWDKVVPLKKKEGKEFQLSVIDPSLKTLKVTELDGESDVLNEPATILCASDGSFYVIQNTTILKGPDHHEINMWSFKDVKSKPIYKHLWGAGDLEYLWVRESSVLPDGSLNVKGYSNDLVNFKKEDVFFRSDFNGKKNEVVFDSLSFSSDIQPFVFDCVYSNKFQLLKYSMKDELPSYYSYMSPEFLPEGILNLENGKKVYYQSVPGTLNTGESPVFKIVITE